MNVNLYFLLREKVLSKRILDFQKKLTLLMFLSVMKSLICWLKMVRFWYLQVLNYHHWNNDKKEVSVDIIIILVTQPLNVFFSGISFKRHCKKEG